jgi:hypothetical protein
MVAQPVAAPRMRFAVELRGYGKVQLSGACR